MTLDCWNARERALLLLNLLVIVCAAYLVYGGASLFPPSAPKLAMTQQDWQKYAWQIFHESFGSIVFTTIALLIFNVAVFGLFAKESIGGALKLVWLRALVLAMLAFVVLIGFSALGAYHVYVAKPPYFD
jgi:threonine/homoserine/homoserine lactone efflux protein